MSKTALTRQTAMRNAPSGPVEAYLAAVPEPAQAALRELRAIILASVPENATEVISYGIPAFTLTRPFFGYAAFKHHLSVLPFSGSIFDSFQQELEPYRRTKSSLHLPFDRPLPVALIQRLVHARLAAIREAKPGSAQSAHG